MTNLRKLLRYISQTMRFILGMFILLTSLNRPVEALTFSDNFNRPNGAVGNGWSVFCGGASIAGGQLQTIGSTSDGGGAFRNLTVTFPLRFSFDFSTADPAGGGWFIAFNAASTLIPGPASAQVSFFQFAGSRNIFTNINDPSAASPNLPENLETTPSFSSLLSQIFTGNLLY